MLKEYGFPEGSFDKKTGFKNWLKSVFSEVSYSADDLREFRGAVFFFNASASGASYNVEVAFPVAVRQDDGRFKIKIPHYAIPDGLIDKLNCACAPQSYIFKDIENGIYTQAEITSALNAHENKMRALIKTDYDSSDYPDIKVLGIERLLHWKVVQRLLREPMTVPQLTPTIFNT